MRIEIHTADDGGNIITTLEPLEFAHGGKNATVPAGFRSDGASVPRFLWDSVSPQIHPETLRAALAHDYIYRVQPAGWTRKDADEMFHDFLVEDGLSRFRAGVAYYGLRLFGWVAWNENQSLAALEQIGGKEE